MGSSRERSTQLSPPDVILPVLGCDSSTASISPSWANVVRFSKLKDGEAFKPQLVNDKLLTKNKKTSVNFGRGCLRDKNQVNSKKIYTKKGGSNQNKKLDRKNNRSPRKLMVKKRKLQDHDHKENQESRLRQSRGI